MAYRKYVPNGYVVAAGEIGCGTSITEEEYSNLLLLFRNKPENPEGYAYVLRDSDLEWELVELPPVEPEPLTDEEALTRYANELTGADDPDLISAAETMITKLSKEE